LEEMTMGNTFSAEANGLNILSRDPLVAGAPLASLDTWVTPTSLFFIRTHFPFLPELDITDWRLTVEGEVERPLRLQYDDLWHLPSKELGCLLECAGNSRAAVQPPVEGLLWDHGGVGNARWKGVPLCTVLEQVGVKATAQEVLLEGADCGKERGASGESGYAMSLPLDKAMHPDTLLAYEMNGAVLSPEHGYPIRAVVPGWYGMTSVKWLRRIVALDQPFQGYHQSQYYVFIKEGVQHGAHKERVTSMRVKSLITWPNRGQVLSIGTHSIQGVAWSGQGAVSRVEVSTDNGRTWHPTNLQDSQSPYAWQQWKFQWQAIEPGYFLIRARATDAQGNTQPEQAPWNFRGFANNSIHAIPVEVRAY
jgi:DMSO/TMAO reductase YedYZ molybdopterin-dependent catalytic subunit